MPIIRLTSDEGRQLFERDRNEIWGKMSTLNWEAKRPIWTRKDVIALMNAVMPRSRERQFREAIRKLSIVPSSLDWNKVSRMQAPALVRGPSDRRGKEVEEVVEEKKEDLSGRKRKRSDDDERERKKAHL